MTELEQELIRRGTALARAMGHRMGFSCPKISPAVPCICGAAAKQAKAIDDWDALVEKINLDTKAGS